MKLLLLATGIAAMFFVSCKKENNTPTTPLEERVDTTVAVKEVTGTFVSAPGESVSGSAKVYTLNGKYVLALEKMNVANGPDLHVYLSKEKNPVNFIDLGKLKSVAGDQLYDINNNFNVTEYKYALIHCQQYNVVFGYALLNQ